jgi:exodeoxyribonuclease VII small subunit
MSNAEQMPPEGDPVSRFEDAMKELEGIVQALERGELRLDEGLKLFERGVALAQQCRAALDVAELKVRNLLGPSPGDTP